MTTTWTDPTDPLVRLPKVSLHDHLDGSLRPETLIELATDAGVLLPRHTPAELQIWLHRFPELEPGRDWEDLFGLSTSVMQTPAQLRRVAREYVHTLAADGVVYAETRWAPEKHLDGGLDIDQAIAAVQDGIDLGVREVAEQGATLHVRQLLSVMRTGHADGQVVEAAARFADAGVVGLDLAGHEEGHPAHAHEAAFLRAVELGLHRSIHAGEADGAGSVADALDSCAAERIGHGARLVEDIAIGGARYGVHDAALAWAAVGSDPAALELGEIASRVRDEGIVLEVCPTSNSTGSIVDRIDQHPLALFERAGIRVSLHPDNRMLSLTSVSKEMRLVVDAFGWGHAQLRESTLAALDAAFGPKELLDRLRAETIEPAWA